MIEQVHLTSRLGEVRAKEVYFNYQDPVLHHHGSQHTVSVSPHGVRIFVNSKMWTSNLSTEIYTD